MAHEITVRGGRAEAVFAGKPAWHGLGQVVAGLMTAKDALDRAGLGWRVVQTPARYVGVDGQVNVVPDRVVNLRSDGGYLGTVGSGYVPVQNEDAFRFLDEVVGTGQAVYEAAGSLWGGRRVFVVLNLPGDLRVADGDGVKRYLVLANGHDGSLAFRTFWTPVRVVCNNTLNLALRQDDADAVAGGEQRVYARHTSNVADRVTEGRRLLGLAEVYYERLGRVFRSLADARITDAGFVRVLNRVLPVPEDGSKSQKARASDDRAAVYAAYREAPGAAPGTAWGAYNGFTHWSCHGVRSGERREGKAERRFEQVLSGWRRDVGQEAYRAVGEECGVALS